MTTSDNPDDLTLSAEHRMDMVCRRFEAECKAGRRPQPEDFLAGWEDAERAALERELRLLDESYRQQRDTAELSGEARESDDPAGTRFVGDPTITYVSADADAAVTVGGEAATPAGSTGDLIAGRYKLLKMIGEGGMGSVYLAEQIEPVKRRVALKLIKAGMDSKGVLARFEAERQALALMDHPNIARIYDGGVIGAVAGPDGKPVASGQPFFVMELVNGIPLTDYCDKHRLTVDARIQLFIAVCQAVQHAHQKGIIHRDLKPGNVLVTEVDGRPTPKVIDFGVAKATEQKLTDLSYTDAGAIVGTPAYMSPEQADPSMIDIDTRSDVYALGVMLYELLVGSPPIDSKQFKRGAILEMLRMVREVEPPRPSTKLSTADALPNIAANRGIDPSKLANLLRGELDWVVMKALEKDRTRRYDTANAMAHDLQRYLADEVVEARPPSRAYRLKKLVRRNRGAVFAANLIALALLAGVIGVIVQWREAVSERDQKETARASAVSERDQKEQARAEAATNARVALEQRRVALDTVGAIVTTVRAELLTKPDLQATLTAVIRIARGSLDHVIQNPSIEISLNDTTKALIHDLAARSLRDQGNTPAALAEFTRAADIFQTILNKAAEGSDKEVVRKNLVIALISVGQTSLRTGSQADARGYYERAAQLLSQVGDKSSADYRKLLIALYQSMGTVTIDRKPREARENYLGALRVAEELAKQETADSGAPTDTSRIAILQMYSLLGMAEKRVRDTAASERAYAKARAMAQERLDAQPTDRARKRDLANIIERIGDVLLRANKSSDAAKEFAAAATYFQALATTDPKNVDAQADLARISYSQGLAAGRDNPAAAKFFQASLDIRKGRPNLETETIGQRDLMMSLAQTGRHRDAIEMAEAVRRKLSKDPSALVDIAACYAVCSARLPAIGADKDTRDRYSAKSFETLRQAIDADYGDKVNLETEPDFDGIRNEPAFKKLLDRIPEP